MKMNNRLLFLMSLFGIVLSSCSANGENKKPSSQQPIKDDTVSVFVLSGQSNMEGSTYWTHPTSGTPLLQNYMEEEGLDFDLVNEGIPNVLTSYYGFFHQSHNAWENAHTASPDKSTPEARLTPNFQPTKVGMGVADKGDNPNPFFGPEVGLAYNLSEYADEDNPIYLEKCAFSGSGFTNGDYNNGDPDWKSRNDDPKESLFYLLKTYTKNCLDAIEESGKTPVIRGFVWHQGESDSGDNKYDTYLKTLTDDFREEFKDYAPDGEGENIAFIDCTIFDSGGQSECNKGKLRFAESEDDLNFCIDASSTGLNLQRGNDAQGGYNTWHYNTKDEFILGQAYANVIIENDLLNL